MESLYFLKNKRLTTSFIYFVSAFLFVTLFSYTTSPLYKEFGDTPDSPIFQIIGKYWALNSIPYRDLWDLKGPYIYLMNALGYLFCGDKIGVYILQIIHILLLLFITHKTFFMYFSSKKSIIYTLFSLVGLSYIYSGGNLVEEYLLPWHAICFYFIMRWMYNYEHKSIVEHPYSNAYIYGLFIGLSLLTRLTNGLSVGAAIITIIVVLLARKKYVNLLTNGIYFILGFATIVIPFLMYFHIHDCLEEMWNATFVYGFEYARHPQFNSLSNGIHYFFLSYINCIFLLILAVLIFLFQSQRRNIAVMYFFIAALPFLWFYFGNGFGHYGMTVFSFFCIIIYELRANYKYSKMLFLLLLIIGFGSKVKYMYFMKYDYKNNDIAAYEQVFMKNNINENSFVAYNCDPQIYLALDIKPAVKYFALQDFPSSSNAFLKPFLLETYKKDKAEWILLHCKENEQPTISTILKSMYKKVYTDKVNELELYRIK